MPAAGPTRPVLLPGDPGTEAYRELAAGPPSLDRSPPGWLRVTVAVLACLLVLVLAGLILDKARPSVLSSLRNRPATKASGGGGTGGPRPSTAVGGSSTSTSSTVAPGSPPRVSSIEPSSGPGGSQVTVLGSGFFSPDRRILVEFGGSPTSTSCPTSTRCLATVPAGARPGTTTGVRVQTQSGQSNAVTFTYR